VTHLIIFIFAIVFTESAFGQTASTGALIGTIFDLTGAGLEAVQKAEELQPDLIVLDIGLPTLNGTSDASPMTWKSGLRPSLEHTNRRKGP
jgi:hypothetical protein